MNCLTQCAYKTHSFNNAIYLEVFVGPPHADPVLKDYWLRAEVKKFKTLDEAKQYMKENY